MESKRRATADTGTHRLQVELSALLDTIYKNRWRRGGQDCEIKSSLVYTAGSRPTGVSSETQTQKRKKKNKQRWGAGYGGTHLGGRG